MTLTKNAATDENYEPKKRKVQQFNWIGDKIIVREKKMKIIKWEIFRTKRMAEELANGKQIAISENELKKAKKKNVKRDDVLSSTWKWNEVKMKIKTKKKNNWKLKIKLTRFFLIVLFSIVKSFVFLLLTRAGSIVGAVVIFRATYAAD